MLICNINLKKIEKRIENVLNNGLLEEYKENIMIKKYLLDNKKNRTIIKDLIIETTAFLLREKKYKEYSNSFVESEEKEEVFIVKLLKNNDDFKEELINISEDEIFNNAYWFLNTILATTLYLSCIVLVAFNESLSDIRVKLMNGTAMIFEYKNNRKIEVNLTYLDLYDVYYIDENGNKELYSESLYNDQLEREYFLLYLTKIKCINRR